MHSESTQFPTMHDLTPQAPGSAAAQFRRLCRVAVDNQRSPIEKHALQFLMRDMANGAWYGPYPVAARAAAGVYFNSDVLVDVLEPAEIFFMWREDHGGSSHFRAALFDRGSVPRGAPWEGALLAFLSTTLVDRSYEYPYGGIGNAHRLNVE